VIAETFYDMMTRDFRPQIPKIKARVPVLLTTGNIPAEVRARAESFYREELDPIPRHEMGVVPGARHYVMFDAPNLFFAQLDRFLAAE
jgi:pimeloyl-ACP methyl ester carboxylesterase